MHVTTPWSITFHDGSGNRYRFWQDDAAARFEYMPVTPATSSSGMYSGGAPNAGNMTATQVRDLWALHDALNQDAVHASAREMGTGSFAVTRAGGVHSFVVRSGSELSAFEAALAPYRVAVTDNPPS